MPLVENRQQLRSARNVKAFLGENPALPGAAAGKRKPALAAAKG